MLGSAEIKTRPLRFAFIVEPGSADQVRAAIRLGSTLWGGVFSPIVPLFRRMPATWRDHGRPAPPAKAVVEGYLDAFDPDVLVQFTSHLPAYVSTTGRHVLKPEDIWEPLRKGNSRNPAYGIGLLEVLDGVFEEHFKYRAKYPVRVVLPAIPSSLSLYWSALLGDIDPDLVPTVEAQYEKPLEIETLNEVQDDLAKLLAPDVLFPRRLVQYGLRRERRNSAARGESCVFFMDASKVGDIVDFWNLRALGRPVLGVPKQLIRNNSVRTLVTEFLRSHRRHWRHDPTSCDMASFIRSRHSTMKEMQAFAESLGLKPPEEDPCKDGYFTMQSWYPRMWDSWARDKDAAIPDDFYSDDDKTIEVGDTEDRSLRVTTVVPAFADSHGLYSHVQCANEITFSVFGASDYLAEAFPASYGQWVLRAIGGIGLGENWRLGRNGVVKMVRDGDLAFLKIPQAEDVLFAWLRDEGWTAELSTPGLLAKQIRRQCEGQAGVLMNAKVLSLLEHMNGGNVTADGKPMDRDKLPVERSLPVEQVRSLLKKADKRLDLHARLLEKGVFRLGVRAQCPSCHRRSWFSLDDVKERVTCQKCLSSFPAAGTLDRSTWAYKTTGPFSVPNHADGAYSVLLALECLGRFGGASLRTTRTLSFTAKKPGEDELEADFAFLWSESVYGERRDGIAFGESKTYGPFLQKDFRRMRQLARKFPGSILIFSTLRETLTSSEKRALIPIARAGRKPWKSNRPLNPVLVLTAREILSWHGPPYCWQEDEKARFQHMHGLLALCDASQQISLGLPPWQHDWQQQWERKRAKFLQRKAGTAKAPKH
ncbi:hypothetical protein [Luteitalea sp.]